MPRIRRGSGIGVAHALAMAMTVAGCHAGLEHAAPAVAPSGGFTITERGETGPVTALAARAPFLWAAGAPGLRRWNLDSGEYESVGEGGEPGSAGIVALAIDDEGGAWVAGPKEIGRWLQTGDDLRYEPRVSPGRVTVLAARRPVRTEGIWAGGPGGLYRSDGRAFLPVEGLRDVPVTSLTLDDDGRAVWVGTRARGLFRAEGERATAVAGGDMILVDEVVGVAKIASGTRVVAGNSGGEARLYALTMAGAEGYRGPAGTRVVALVERAGDAALVAGPPGKEQAYALRALAPGEAAPPGSLRFASMVRERGGRFAAVPLPVRLPPAVTVVAAAGVELYAGSARMGIARAASEAPAYLQGAELVGDAERLEVGCVARARCFVVTDGPHAWQTDGEHYQSTHVGEPAGAAVLALAVDNTRGALYAISGEARPPGLAVTKHSGADAGGAAEWQPLHRVALELPPRTTPRASFAALSPAGALWVGLRAASGNGGEIGFGAVEIDLSNGHAVEHRPYRPNEHAAAEALPLPASVTGMLFDGGATWVSSVGGISRWQEGQMRTWSENDGLASELVHALGRGTDGAILAATSQGLVRFDGKDWRSLGAATIAVRGLATDGKGRVWLATNKGLRLLERASRDSSGNAAQNSNGQGSSIRESSSRPSGDSKDTSASAADPSTAPVVLAGDMRDVVVDRFGRVWAMSASAIALIEEK